ncbi:MAG: hypothetical protein QM296_12810, partial [Bacillota bacterium]|nr:hypothetical protein [Bacillota bacterium]
QKCHLECCFVRNLRLVPLESLKPRSRKALIHRAFGLDTIGKNHGIAPQPGREQKNFTKGGLKQQS